MNSSNLFDEPPLTSLSRGGGCGCKIAPGLLSELISKFALMPLPKDYLVGVNNFDDAAVYKLNDTQALIATTDFFMPIVNQPFDFGRIAATNAISDVYAMGGQPILALAISGMPTAKISKFTIQNILEGGSSACADAGIAIAGGHSIDSAEPFYGLVVLGLVHPNDVCTNSGAKLNDIVVLGKPIGIGIMSAAIKKGRLSQQAYSEMIAVTTQLNTPGPKLAKLAGVHAMTDVTGFGLAGHLLELATAARCEIQIDWNKVPILPQAHSLLGEGIFTGASRRNWESCQDTVVLPNGFGDANLTLLTDPQTSGGLLVCCDPFLVEKVLSIFNENGFYHASKIGKIVFSNSKPLIRVY